MSTSDDIREGMPLYGSDGELLGTVERVAADRIHVGRDIPRGAVDRVAEGRVYLREPAARALGWRERQSGGAPPDRRAEGEVRVPLHEERLAVEKREAELGAVELRKTVEAEERTVPVELAREAVRVRREDAGDRPVRPGEEVFQERTIGVPVRGEEPVVAKEAVITGEVVVHKERTTARQEIADTVRRERVEVDEDVGRGPAGGRGTASR